VSVTPIASLSDSDPGSSQARERWFDEEVRPLELALRAYLQRRYPTMVDVDDVVQESFLKAFLAWQKGRLTSVRGFLFTVAGNITVSVFRRRKFLAPTRVSELPPMSVADDNVNVVESVCSHEELVLIAEAIATLPDRCRQVAVLRLLRGYECRAIAQKLAI